MANKSDRINGLNPTGGMNMQNNQSKEFDKLEQYAKLMKPPAIKFKDLENELVTHKIISNPMPFDVRTDFVKVTERHRAGAHSRCRSRIRTLRSSTRKAFSAGR